MAAQFYNRCFLFPLSAPSVQQRSQLEELRKFGKEFRVSLFMLKCVFKKFINNYIDLNFNSKHLSCPVVGRIHKNFTQVRVGLLQHIFYSRLRSRNDSSKSKNYNNNNMKLSRNFVEKSQ